MFLEVDTIRGGARGIVYLAGDDGNAGLFTFPSTEVRVLIPGVKSFVASIDWSLLLISIAAHCVPISVFMIGTGSFGLIWRF